jgi:hypothetical protein
MDFVEVIYTGAAQREYQGQLLFLDFKVILRNLRAAKNKKKICPIDFANQVKMPIL